MAAIESSLHVGCEQARNLRRVVKCEVAKLVFSTLKTMRPFADFKEGAIEDPSEAKEVIHNKPETNSDFQRSERSNKLGLNLSYTINLNLPATSDQAVF